MRAVLSAGAENGKKTKEMPRMPRMLRMPRNLPLRGVPSAGAPCAP